MSGGRFPLKRFLTENFQIFKFWGEKGNPDWSHGHAVHSTWLVVSCRRQEGGGARTFGQEEYLLTSCSALQTTFSSEKHVTQEMPQLRPVFFHGPSSGRGFHIVLKCCHMM